MSAIELSYARLGIDEGRRALDEVRQSVCLDIAFNQGLHGLLKYPRMIAALTRQDWEGAAAECDVADPRLKPRYERLAQILRMGSV